MTEEVTETVLLKGHCGKNWNLKLREDENGTFFHGADWKKFQKKQHFEGGYLEEFKKRKEGEKEERSRFLQFSRGFRQGSDPKRYGLVPGSPAPVFIPSFDPSEFF
ncbi:hypothetical protein MTR67_003797 [Solanum verrucosum]|uniref:TF-B3 domain-containing protein n=1 Tax=Solanum verrucosum TaxID=315347 RepID=A0AAF0PTF1_SOLVR|nr:hypothetical protein MTR67_003797 [Solanum verrucosum]